MGKIKELLDKKKSGEITEAEQKELDSLIAEAKMADEATTPEPSNGEDDESVEEAAQKMADLLQKRDEERDKKLDKVLEALADKNVEAETKDFAFIVDKKLGKKHSIEDLSDMKVELPGRKQAGKKYTEVSQKSVEFLSAVFTGDHQKLQVLTEGTPADGGYLVPEEFANIIVEDIRDQSIMRQLATVMTTQSNQIHIPSLVSRPQAAWRSEAAAKQTSTATFTENVLTPYSLAVIVGLSNELVADARLGVGGSIVNYLAGLMATSLNEAEEKAFWVGSGSGQPTGVNGNTGRTFTAGSSDSSRADTLIQAYQQTPQGYRNKAVWVANMGTLYEIGRLKDSQNRYLLTDLANSPTQTIKGRPVYESNYLPGGTAFFGDFSYYYIADREGIRIDISNEATVASTSAFEKNLTYVRVEKRVDGELILPAAVTTVAGLGTP